jgi:hypothetical protein
VPFLTQAGALALMKCLYQCFFSIAEISEALKEILQQLFSNVEDYFTGCGICTDMMQYVSAINNKAQHNGVSPNLIMVYHSIGPIASTSPPPLFKLTYHILLICPNSASCECLFSIFRNTLTKLRNCLGNQTLTSLAELKMHIQDEHLSTVPQVPHQPFHHLN